MTEKPSGWIYWNGGSIINQTDKTLNVELWLKDEQGYAFDVIVNIRKNTLKKMLASSERRA